MNARASLVDSWRLIQVNADALQSVLNVTASGDLRTARNNAASFRAPTGNVRLGLEFDVPRARLLERNSYRESFINYQRSRCGKGAEIRGVPGEMVAHDNSAKKDGSNS